MKLLGQNILEKYLSQFFAKTMYSRYDFPVRSRFYTKVRPHFFRRQYSRSLLCGQKRKGQIYNTLSTLQNGVPKKLGSGPIVWTLTLWTLRPLDFGRSDSRRLDTWTLDAWTLGLWKLGCLDSGRLTLELWTPERLYNRPTFSNYTFATKVIQ